MTILRSLNQFDYEALWRIHHEIRWTLRMHVTPAASCILLPTVHPRSSEPGRCPLARITLHYYGLVDNESYWSRTNRLEHYCVEAIQIVGQEQKSRVRQVVESKDLCFTNREPAQPPNNGEPIAGISYQSAYSAGR